MSRNQEGSRPHLYTEKVHGSGGPFSKSGTDETFRWGDVSRGLSEKEKAAQYPPLKEKEPESLDLPSERALSQPSDITNIIYNYKADDVKIAGDFTKWRLEPMQHPGGAKKGWLYQKKLAPGEYKFRFFVNGKWKVDSSKSVLTEEDGKQYNWVNITAEPSGSG